MSLMERFSVHKGKEPDQAKTAAPDLWLDAALGDFCSSVHAWSAQISSQAAGNRAEPEAAAAPHGNAWQWRLSRRPLGWALGCMLLAGGVSGGVWEHQQQQRKVAEARAAAQQRLAAQLLAQQASRAEQRGGDGKDFLAQVDSDVAQEVPTAMAPLAQLMVDDDTQ